MHSPTGMCLYAYIHTYIHMQVWGVCWGLHTYIHKYIHTYIHIYIHTHAGVGCVLGVGIWSRTCSSSEMRCLYGARKYRESYKDYKGSIYIHTYIQVRCGAFMVQGSIERATLTIKVAQTIKVAYIYIYIYIYICI